MPAYLGLESGVSPLGRTAPSRRVMLSVAAVVFVGMAVSILVARANYLLFHSLVELFSVTVAVMIGVIAWYTFGFTRNHFLAFLGAADFRRAGDYPVCQARKREALKPDLAVAAQGG